MHRELPYADAHDVRHVELWSLREDVRLEQDTVADTALLHTCWGRVRLTRLGAMAHEALRRMTFGPVSLDNAVSARLKDAEGPNGEVEGVRRDQERLDAILEHLQHLVVRSLGLEDADQPLLSVVPVAPGAVFRLPEVGLDCVARLSRFASLRSEDDEMVVESPLSLHRVVLHRNEAARVLFSLAQPRTVADIVAAAALPRPVVVDLVRYLVAAGAVLLSEPSGEDREDLGRAGPGRARPGAGAPRFAEDTDPALLGWAPAEMLFHTRSRFGRYGPYGSGHPPLGGSPAEPLLKPVPQGARTALPRPSLDEVLSRDLPLTAVLESRRSVRRYGEAALTLEQVGELLYRSARVRAKLSVPGSAPSRHLTTSRPYPTGGSSYELEIYATVGRCEGLDRGVYYYDPCDHCLVLVDQDAHAVTRLLGCAQVGAGMHEPPPLLLTITARFGRVSRKYSGMWYALILKDVGVLQQTLYLVSTAMGLAPCALGGGDMDASARSFRLDWREESSVGEFLVGPRPSDQGMRESHEGLWCDISALTESPVNDPAWARSFTGQTLSDR
ncbi:SagB/ThcOx family dehydrogenase [Wenjunlia tyrosinilytica]|uniref:SagB-type dehydrogenase domain-containing protein n=1 Tax=Wenjunlia tyrosinilytica TaxID=1544741 RepID=A0A918DYZ3_9ACTN|nr:SagB family peptide dehydrogenase [Wenjunlia tyrosinilytica]GGO89006.1 SagB-type dehydrogenase domain-containing protein [Wenjunlia tyrosinilytica]